MNAGGNQQEMTFLEHLEALRWHIIRSVIAVLVFFIAALICKDILFHDILLGPSRTNFFTYRLFCRLAEKFHTPALCIDELPFIIQSRKVTGQFTMHIAASFVAGVICAFPYIVFEIYRFLSPGLKKSERRYGKGGIFFVSLLFFLGVLFGYFVVSPISVNFLANYQVDPSVVNQFDITSYVSTILMLVLACGLMFQLPVVVYVLTRLTLLGPATMRKYRKHAFVVIMFTSAVITPPDLISQILITLPLILLYEISIFISLFISRRQDI